MRQHNQGDANPEDNGREDMVNDEEEQRSTYEEDHQRGDDAVGVSRSGGVDCEKGAQVLINVQFLM